MLASRGRRMPRPGRHHLATGSSHVTAACGLSLAQPTVGPGPTPATGPWVANPGHRNPIWGAAHPNGYGGVTICRPSAPGQPPPPAPGWRTRGTETPSGEQLTRTDNGNATAVRSRTNVTTTPRSTSHATRNHLASSAQLGPPSSVEPTVRPGLARRVAVKRGREPATRLANNPETGCRPNATPDAACRCTDTRPRG